jgi:integrase
MYGRTKKAAQVKLAKAMREKERGVIVIASPTVESWLTYWLDVICVERGLKVNTMKSHRQKVDHYLIPHLGRHRLDKLTPEHVRSMYRALRDQGLSEATLRQVHAILHRALKVAEREGKVARNVAGLIDPPATTRNKRTGLTVAQARKVLEAGDLRAWVALYLGLRQGEALALRWSDVDLDRGWLWVERSLIREPGVGLVFDKPKSEASVRNFRIPPKALAQFKLARALDPDADPDALIFHVDGKPIDHRADWQTWTDLLDKVGVPHVALHAARNTTASLLEAAGVPDRIVAQILGQSTIEVTHGYQHAEDSVLDDAMLALEAYVEGD